MVSKSGSIFKFMHRTSERGGAVLHQFLTSRPWATRTALMGCRNVITALMHTLKLSSLDLTSSFFQDTYCFWETIHTLGLYLADSMTFFCNVSNFCAITLECILVNVNSCWSSSEERVWGSSGAEVHLISLLAGDMIWLPIENIQFWCWLENLTQHCGRYDLSPFSLQTEGIIFILIS